MIRAVLDTNVIYSGLNSRRGASFLLLQQLPGKAFEICLSTPLVLEYEHALKKGLPHLTSADKEAFLDYLCAIGNKTRIFYLWRPTLKDPNDDMVLELAVSSGSKYIVTFNLGDFKGAERFGISPIRPKEILKITGVLP